MPSAQTGRGDWSLSGGTLEEEVVAPLAGDPEVATSKPDSLESVLLQHPLRRSVVHERRSLEAVEPKVLEGDADNLAHGPGREASSVDPLRDPVAQCGAVEGVRDDVRHAHGPGNATAVEDREPLRSATLDPLALARGGEEAFGTNRAGTSQELAVLDQHSRQLAGV